MVENKIAVDRNHQALKRILASLFAMAGWTATGGTFLRACSDAGSASILPRHLYVAILRLLRPAEAATRRLVIVLSRGISVTLPPQRAAKPKPGPVLLKDGRAPASSTPASLSTGWVSPMSHHPLRPNPPLLRPARSPSPCWIPCAIRSPTAAPQSGAAPYPAACTTSLGFVPFGCGSRHPMTRSTPRVSASALPHWPRRWTTCRPRPCTSRAGKPTGTGRGTECASNYPLGHRPRSDFAVSGRCGRAARPVAACRASIRSPGGCPESAKSTRFWPTPMRWPFMPWSSRASDTPTLHDSTS